MNFSEINEHTIAAACADMIVVASAAVAVDWHFASRGEVRDPQTWRCDRLMEAATKLAAALPPEALAPFVERATQIVRERTAITMPPEMFGDHGTMGEEWVADEIARADAAAVTAAGGNT